MKKMIFTILVVMIILVGCDQKVTNHIEDKHDCYRQIDSLKQVICELKYRYRYCPERGCISAVPENGWDTCYGD